MKRPTRRSLVVLGLGALGAGGLVAGGSVAACRLGTREALIVRPLYFTLTTLPHADRIGHHWLDQRGSEEIERHVRARTDLAAVSMLPDLAERRDRFEGLVRAEFAARRTVLAGSFLVSETEALVAGAWASDDGYS